METEASLELKKIDKIKERTKPLRDRMDEDFLKLRGDPFKMPEAEGTWDNVTSNRSQAEGWKITNSLASAQNNLSIVLLDDKEKDREDISNTEMLANGLLYSADRRFDGMPDQPPLNSQMAFYIPVRGWSAYRVLVLEDEDGIPYADIAVWDVRNTYWLPGKNGLIWVCYERISDEDSIKDEYKGWNGKVDNKGYVTVYDVWSIKKGNTAQEAVIIGKEYVKEPTDVLVGGQKIDYLPIRVKACGTIPLIKDDNEDNIKHVGESYLVNTRELQEPESRVLTYNLTRAGMEAKMPTIIIFDSIQGDLPPEFDKDPFVKGRFIPLDKAKGQEMGDVLPMSQGNSIEIAASKIDRMRSRGGLGEVAFGEYANVSMTAMGTDILNSNTREHIWPFKLAMENDYVWIATELVKQFKNGSYKAAEFKGYDSKGNGFCKKLKPKDVRDDRQFKCQLIVDELRNRATQSNMAIQEVKAGLLSRREALDVHKLSQDPDRTLDMLAQEMADQMFDTPAYKGFLQKVEDYQKSKTPEKKMELEHAFEVLMMLRMQQKQVQQQVSTGPNPQPNRNRIPGSTPTAEAPNG